MNMILCEMRCTHKCIQTSKFRLGIKVKTGITWTEVFCLKYPKPLTNTSERLRSTAEMSKTRGRRGGRAAGSEFRGKGGLSLYVPVYTSACVENWRGSWAADPQRLLSNGEQTDSRKTSALIRTCLLHLPLFISQLHWWPGNRVAVKRTKRYACVSVEITYIWNTTRPATCIDSQPSRFILIYIGLCAAKRVFNF